MHNKDMSNLTGGIQKLCAENFEATDLISLAGLLKCNNGRALLSHFNLEVLIDFSEQSLEARAILVSAGFSQSNNSWKQLQLSGFLTAPVSRALFLSALVFFLELY